LLPAGIADQDIQSAETVDRLSDHLPAPGFLADVAGKSDRFPAFFLDEVDHFTGIGLLCRIIADRYVCPSLAKAMAAARPMPESPPVISALRPMSRPEPL